MAVKHLKSHGAGAMITKLEQSKIIITIKEKNGTGSYNSKTRTIKWDPNAGAIVGDFHYVSPATILNHEADHALQHITHYNQYKKDRKKGSDSQYDTKEERRVITGSEQKTARKLGEINKDEVTRTNHKSDNVTTKGPTSNHDINEVTIKPKKKKQ